MAMERQKRTDKQNKKTQVKDPPRRKPGSSGKGDYYHVEVRPGERFVTFRTQDVGRRGHIQRVAGQRFSGYWTTVKWLIGKEDAHVQGAKLVADTKDARDVIEQLATQPVHVIGDRFKARPSGKIPESANAKATPASTPARRKYVKKAQTVRTKKK